MSDGDRPSPEEIEERIEEGKAWTRETEPPRSGARPSGPPSPGQRRPPEPADTVVDDSPDVLPDAPIDKS